MSYGYGKTYELVAPEDVWSDITVLPPHATMQIIGDGGYPVEMRTTETDTSILRVAAAGAQGDSLVIPWGNTLASPRSVQVRGVGGASRLRLNLFLVTAGIAPAAPGGTGVALSLSNDPAAALGEAAAPGVAVAASRGDHVHPLPSIAPAVLARVFDLGTPAAADSDAIHDAQAGNVGLIWPGPISNPDQPRNLTVYFDGLWDGGDVVVAGTDQYDDAIEETFAPLIGATRSGVKVFKTVTEIRQTNVGANTAIAEVGTGSRLGLTVSGDVTAVQNAGFLMSSAGNMRLATIDPVAQSVWDATEGLMPNGFDAFSATINVVYTPTLS